MMMIWTKLCAIVIRSWAYTIRLDRGGNGGKHIAQSLYRSFPVEWDTLQIDPGIIFAIHHTTRAGQTKSQHVELHLPAVYDIPFGVIGEFDQLVKTFFIGTFALQQVRSFRRFPQPNNLAIYMTNQPRLALGKLYLLLLMVDLTPCAAEIAYNEPFNSVTQSEEAQYPALWLGAWYALMGIPKQTFTGVAGLRKPQSGSRLV